MKYLITILAIFFTFFAEAQKVYNVVQIDSVDWAIQVSEELPNGQTNITWLPSDGYLDSVEITSALLQLAENESTYSARAERQSYLYNRQFRNLILLINQTDTSYYDYTWAKYAEQLAKNRYFLFVDGQRIEANAIVNRIGRLILQTESGNALVKIDSPESLTIANSADVGSNVSLVKVAQDSRRVIYRGVSEDGKNIALVRVK